MIKHIVLWKVKPARDKEALMRVHREFSDMLEHLKQVIPEIVEARAAVSYLDGDVFDLCIDSVFKTREDLDTYMVHPDHVKVKEYLNSVTCDKAVFDYEY